MATIQTRALALEEGFMRRLTTGLLAATSLVGPQVRSPYDRFGVLVAGDVAPRLRGRRESGFTVREARSRIGDFLDGTFKPRSIGELMHYLSGRMMRIEARKLRDGKSANYLVDRATRQSVLAATVDRRLARPGLARMFGRTLDAEAEALRRKIEQSPEMTDARRLRSINASRLLSANGKIPFTDWEDLRFSAPAMFEGREVTAQGREVWLGTEYARASTDPEQNLRMMRKAQAEGRRLVFPARTKSDVAAGRLIPGMPVLLREGAVRSKLVDPSMTFEAMAEKFGEDPFKHFEVLGERFGQAEAMSNAAPQKVVSMADFKARFSKRKDPAPSAAPEVVTGVRRAGSRYVVRHELAEGGREVFFLHDSATGQSGRVDPRKLPAGRYAKEDAFGLPSGSIVVDAERGFAHYDEQERFHNPYGPAIVAGPESKDPPRWAVDGEFMSRREFDGLRGGFQSVKRMPAERPAADREAGQSETVPSPEMRMR